MSDPEVADAALRIQGAMKGMLYRQRQSLLDDDADSVDRFATVDEADVPDTGEDDDLAPEVSVHSAHEAEAEEALEQGSQHSKRSGQSQASGPSGQADEHERHDSSVVQQDELPPHDE